MASLVREQEPGCALYQVARSREDPDHCLLYEQYTDEAALQAHRATPRFKNFIEDTVFPLLERREPQFYDPVVG
jgi:autoinducer 2-degrading protein